MAPLDSPLVVVRGLSHSYSQDAPVMVGLALDLAEGQLLAAVGGAGSGKTTLLNVLAGVMRAQEGQVQVAGHDLRRMTDDELAAYRRHVVGYAWQKPEAGLLGALTALQNVMVPMLVEGGRKGARVRRAVAVLEALGLGARFDRRPAKLLHGEAQRLALAVALANEPRLLLADEPTADMDRTASRELLADLIALLRSTGTAAIIATRDQHVVERMDEVGPLGGRLQPDARLWAEDAERPRHAIS